MATNKTAQHGLSKASMRNVIQYVLQDNKIKDNLTYMSGPFEYDEINWNNVYKSFCHEKKMWNKMDGRQYLHHIISFPPNEKITPEQVLEFGKEFVDSVFSDNQALIAVHQDKEHIHIHIVVNTVSFVDGKKIHQSAYDLQRMKDLTNTMCIEKGLSIAVKGQHYDGSLIEKGEVISWKKNQYNMIKNNTKNSFLVDCAKAVMDSIKSAINRDSFIGKMQNKGWSTNWNDSRKNITFINADGKKVRNSKLEKTFNIKCSKDELEKIFDDNRMKIKDTEDVPIQKRHIRIKY